MRAVSLLVHRWVGLVIASFLIVAGLTGSVIAFYPELDEWLNPELYQVAPKAVGARPLGAVELHGRVSAAFPEQVIRRLPLRVEPGRSVRFWFDEREHFFDPYTGQLIAARRYGDIAESWQNLPGFLYKLHYSLHLGKGGQVIVGIAAVLWTLDCFVGAYLTFPAPAQRRQERSLRVWISGWGRAFLLKTKQLTSLLFSWHRASGLWLWVLLLSFAWSGVALNLNKEVYRPVMDLVLPHEDSATPRLLDAPRLTAKLSWSAALERARLLMAALAARHDFQVVRERWLVYEPEFGAYSYTVESTRDLAERLPRTRIRFDGDDGRLLEFDAAIGRGARRAVDTWLIALHFGSIRQLGLAYRIFVSVFGVAVTLLSATGVWIWLRKRKKRSRPVRIR